MSKWLKKLFRLNRKLTKPEIEPKETPETDEAKLYASMANGCPDCGCDKYEVVARAGIAVNIKCCSCGAAFNIVEPARVAYRV